LVSAVDDRNAREDVHYYYYNCFFVGAFVKQVWESCQTIRRAREQYQQSQSQLSQDSQSQLESQDQTQQQVDTPLSPPAKQTKAKRKRKNSTTAADVTANGDDSNKEGYVF
jgi:hypothetical protein